MAASASNTGGAAVAPAPDDSSTSFEDALQQQGVSTSTTTSSTSSAPPDWQAIIADVAGKASQVSTSALVTAPTASGATPTTTPTANPLASEPTPSNSSSGAVPLPAIPKVLVPKDKSAPTDTSTNTTTASSKTSSSGPLYTGSSVFIAHSAILAAQARQSSASKDAAPDSETASASDAENTTAAATTTLADEFGLSLSFPKAATKTTGSATAEKKSDSTPSQGSFLQSDTTVANPSWMLSGAVSPSQLVNIQDSISQTVTNHSGAPENTVNDLSGDATGAAGMANGKKEKDMNATLDLPNLVASTGTDPMTAKASPDLTIQLGSNQGFKDALGQVMRVAEVSGLSSTTPPLRVAIEIQTPPGAIVNVYVSKQDDGYRAQLSATDPQALSYVQDQISSLRQSTDTGVSVRWLPAQLETSSSLSSGSSSNESGLSWDRGGQGQQGQQQQADERRQASQQKKPLFDGLVSTGRSTTFKDAFSTVGRVA
jgi:hypothetical protein